MYVYLNKLYGDPVAFRVLPKIIVVRAGECSRALLRVQYVILPGAQAPRFLELCAVKFTSLFFACAIRVKVNVFDPAT